LGDAAQKPPETGRLPDSLVESCKTPTPNEIRTPKYRLHKPTGQAVVTIDGRDHYAKG